MKHLALLGSTGSIGKSTLEIVREHPESFRVVSLSAHSQIDVLKEQIEEFRPKSVVVSDFESYLMLKECQLDVACRFGEEGFAEVVSEPDVDMVVNGLVGFSGLFPTMHALRNAKDVAIANKETLVVAGKLITDLAKENKAQLIPIDSEHNALLSLLRHRKHSEVRSLILTSSGGPFRETQDFTGITQADALKHPTWSMGKKITIDSATLLNKGFEVIEAHHLFGFPFEQIEVIIHKESLIHSMIETIDGQIYAQIGPKDMKFPILNALTYPDIQETHSERLRLDTLKRLSFEAVDHERFPLLRLAYDIGRRGGIYPCVLNAANEVAVAEFLHGNISYLDIQVIIEQILSTSDNTELSFDTLKQYDQSTRARTLKLIKKLRGAHA